MNHLSNRHKILQLAVFGAFMTFPVGSLFDISSLPAAKSIAPSRLAAQIVPRPQPMEDTKPTPLPENNLGSEFQVPADENGVRFEQVMQYAIEQQLHDRPFGDVMQAIAEQFIGTPYVAGLLDRTKEEKLVISLNGFDCVLFVETVLAIARGVAVQDYSYQSFSDRLLEQRYRNGKLNGYCSRLHYFSDWISDNQNRGIVENITQKVGGFPLPKQLNFMTQHRSSYPQLASETNYQCLQNVEASLNQLNLDYIPQNQIYTVYDSVQPGDIIATATDIDGLDVTHTGLVYKNPDGTIGFIHASISGEVKISPDLQSYVEAVDGQIGIILARPVDSREMTSSEINPSEPILPLHKPSIEYQR